MTSAPERHQLFISYSRADREWVDRLKTMLAPLVRGDDLRLWDDSQIPPGARWQEEIARALATARVAVLLVSADFLHSDYVNNKELPPLLRAAEEEGLELLWVCVRHCLVDDTPIHAFQAAIDPGRPLAALAPWEQDEALAKVAKAIKGAFQRAREREARLREHQDTREKEAREKQAREEEAREQAARETEARAAAAREREREREKEANAREAREKEARPATPANEALGLSRQRLPDGASAELLSERSGLLGQRRWRVERVGLSRVWGVVEELAPGVDLQLVEIAAGTFVMGSPAGEEGRDVYKNCDKDWMIRAAVAGKDVEAQRQVTVPACWLGRFPITQAQWQVVAGWPQLERELDPDPARFKGADRPVEQVSWEEALEFCRRLSQRTGRAYSLPSEALWEWACRAGTTTPFHFGAILSPEVANFDGNFTYGDGPKGEFREHTTPVGLFPANGWGLHDMHGNLWEWCLDRWHPSPRHGPSDGRPWLEPSPEVPSEGRDLRLLRGGSWFSVPHYCRSASRGGTPPGNRDDCVGFRVCCLPPGLPSWSLNP
jgi:formylglycine-generating enzyme required for sulfatase activity